MFDNSNFKRNVLLKDYTTFKIGGKAKYFFIAKNKEDVIESVKWAIKNNENFFILGGGSNVLFSDDGFGGLVIKSVPPSKIKTADLGENKISMLADAGVKLSFLTDFCRANAIKGFEWAAGIPGTIGGAVRGNVGAFGRCTANNIKNVEVMETGGAVKNFSCNDCQFEYRSSLFKLEKEKYIILSILFEAEKGNKEEIAEAIRKNLKCRADKQADSYPSAGCIFKNVAFDKSMEDKNFPRNFKNPKLIPAAWLIEQCGLKGKKVGGAKISEKHSNFIINMGEAKASDVKELIKIIEKNVLEKYAIKLEKEVKIA